VPVQPSFAAERRGASNEAYSMHTYEQDIVAWAREQAGLLRAGRFDALDIEHLAEEIEDVGKSEQRELESWMAVLVAHLLKWRFQPERRGNSWRNTIRAQRKGVERRLKKTPSLKADLNDADWWEAVWDDAVARVGQETGLDFPESPLWTPEQSLQPDFFPNHHDRRAARPRA
jgi:hypothetical protein